MPLCWAIGLKTAEVSVGAVAESLEGGPQDVEVGATRAVRHVATRQRRERPVLAG